MRSLNARRRPATTGFTLVELLVVIAIIGMLVALLVPAVNAARARMRKATCLNNLSQIGKALTAYESSKQSYPGYVQSVKVRGRENKNVGYLVWQAGDPSNAPYVDSGYINNEGTDSNDKEASQIGWPAMILDGVDRGDISELMTGAEAGNPGSDPLVAQQIVPKLEVYICPDDTDLANAEGAAGISYAANTGAWDLSSSAAYLGDSKDNGMFHNLVYGNVKTRMGGISDGTSTTLMVVENVTKNENYSWLGVAAGGEQQFGVVWVPKVTPLSGCGSLITQYAFSDDGSNDNVAPGEWEAALPCFARPASYHSGGSFNVVFADGHGQSLNKDIDYIIYQQLLTTHGTKCVDPNGSASTASDIQTFQQAAPLSASDLE